MAFPDAPSSVENPSPTELSYTDWATGNETHVPQRYSDNHHRYLRVAGALDIGRLLDGFAANNPNNRGDLNRFFTLALIFDQIIKEQLPGDIAELGVYKGNTAFMLADLARRVGATAYLFDTFQGFDQADMAGIDADKRPEFADTSLAQVTSLVGSSSVRYVEGYFPGTASEIPADARFCLAHIDCDLYAPFKSALAFFYERLVPGGFLIMHDYSSLHWDGAERAVDEFFADKAESVMPVPDGSGTVVVRRAKPTDKIDNWFAQSRVTGFARAWVDANSRGSADLLGDGWSGPESWGVWGVGPRHTLRLILTAFPDNGLEIEAESQAVLIGERLSLTVAVCVEDEVLETWSYGVDANLAIRTVRVPTRLIGSDEGLPALELEFRPSRFESPHTLDPKISDQRLLGLGLLRFRQRPV